jgi:hypothetical protein
MISLMAFGHGLALPYSGGERPTFSPLHKGRVLGVALSASF